MTFRRRKRAAPPSYTEQTSILLPKYLDEREQERALHVQLDGNRYTFILDAACRWSAWAAPKTPDGAFDHNHNNAPTGPDLIDFVSRRLFPICAGSGRGWNAPTRSNTGSARCSAKSPTWFRSGYSQRDAVELVDALCFRSHERSSLQADGQCRTQRRGILHASAAHPRPWSELQPRICERVYNGAAGSAGFLCEPFEYLRARTELTTADLKTLQEHTFHGTEKKSLAYVQAIMN